MRWPLVWRRTMDENVNAEGASAMAVYQNDLDNAREMLAHALTRVQDLSKSNRSLRGVITKLRAEKDELKAELAETIVEKKQ